jgi:large subunit ribosomal protein L24
MKIKKGDTVKILYGKDSGKTGKVLRVVDKESKIVVDGVNVYKKHIKGDGQKRTSEIVEVVKPMNVAKVMIVCPECSKTTKIGMKIIDGKKMRICKKCGKVFELNNVAEVKVEKSEKKVAKAKKVVKK